MKAVISDFQHHAGCDMPGTHAASPEKLLLRMSMNTLIKNLSSSMPQLPGLFETCQTGPTWIETPHANNEGSRKILMWTHTNKDNDEKSIIQSEE